MEVNKYRNRGYNIINKILKDDIKSKVIENSIYNYTLERAKLQNYKLDFSNELFRLTYKNKVMSLYINLNEKSKIVNNKNLVKKIRNNEINLDKIAFLKPQELFPENWDEIIRSNEARKKLEEDRLAGRTTDIYTCSRCNKNKCITYSLQIRSCDEPKTTFVICVNCSNSWSFS